LLDAGLEINPHSALGGHITSLNYTSGGFAPSPYATLAPSALSLLEICSIAATTDAVVAMLLRRWRHCCHEYDTIRDAISTCAQKLILVNLIYRTETTTEKWKREN